MGLEEIHRYATDARVTWRRRSDGFVGKISSVRSENEPGRQIAIEPYPDRSTVIYVSLDEMASDWKRVAQRQCPRCRTSQWAEVGGHFVGHGCNELMVAEAETLRTARDHADEALRLYVAKQDRREKAGRVFDEKGLLGGFLTRIFLAERRLADCRARMGKPESTESPEV